MILRETSPTDRREWLRNVIRYGALGGLATLTACLTLRRWGRDCSRWSSACEACQLLPGCALPSAASVRNTRQAKEKA